MALIKEEVESPELRSEKPAEAETEDSRGELPTGSGGDFAPISSGTVADAATALLQPPYTYGELLSRLRASVAADHPAHPSLQRDDERRRSNVPPPQLARVGGRRVAICNLGAIASALHRTPTHLRDFLLAELATTGSLDGATECLTVLAALQQKHVEALVRKYVHEYVACGECKALDTRIAKAGAKGGDYLRCACCSAERQLAPITDGFRAVRRGERRLQRAAAPRM